MERLTIEKLLEKKEKIENDKIIYYQSKELDGELEIHKQSIYKILSKIDGIEGKNIEDAFIDTCKLIYDHVPLFKHAELQKEFECVEPYEIVHKIFNDNMKAINDLSLFILKLYGTGEDTIKDIKN